MIKINLIGAIKRIRHVKRRLVQTDEEKYVWMNRDRTISELCYDPLGMSLAQCKYSIRGVIVECPECHKERIAHMRTLFRQNGSTYCAVHHRKMFFLINGYLHKFTVGSKDKAAKRELLRTTKKHSSRMELRRLREVKEAEREKTREWRLLRRKISGNLLTLFRMSIERFWNEGKEANWGCFRHLEFTRDDLVSHIHDQLVKNDYMCPSCKKPLTWKTLTIEHDIPRRIASSYQELLTIFKLDNTSILCASCNSKKGGKILQKSVTIRPKSPHVVDNK